MQIKLIFREKAFHLASLCLPLDAALLLLANNKDDFCNTGPGASKKRTRVKK